MYKVEILLDEEKIKKIGEFKVENILKAILTDFENVHLPRIETTDGSLVFRTVNDDYDYGVMWSLIMDLYQEDWFRPYLLKYNWYSDRENDDGSWYMEDLLQEYHNMGFCE